MSCNMSPNTIELDNQTTIHFWITNHRHIDKPNLVLIHGYGGNSRLQFLNQVKPLSESFNLYIPDLLFFGKSHTSRADRSDVFQAKCLREGLRRLGLDKYNLVGTSYGGYVAYQMCDGYGDEVEKVVIVSCGLCYTEEQKKESKEMFGKLFHLLLPEKPEHAKEMMKLAIYKTNRMLWLPDFVHWVFINAMTHNRRKEKLELLEHLLSKKAEAELPILTQETLLIWGDQDNIFPVFLAHQLHRHLGAKSRVEIIKDTGHAANIESPAAVNSLITSFVLGAQS
ncbi:uncharacterized protein [Euphorbia lathyris]|uniref:uncharacterized protein isoform X3 n=1 Tax=Euphorbia lathyris TaxID=212925 RepID=UPI003313164C